MRCPKGAGGSISLKSSRTERWGAVRFVITWNETEKRKRTAGARLPSPAFPRVLAVKQRRPTRSNRLYLGSVAAFGQDSGLQRLDGFQLGIVEGARVKRIDQSQQLAAVRCCGPVRTVSESAFDLGVRLQRHRQPFALLRPGLMSKAGVS
jgi:hypothetical protein